MKTLVSSTLTLLPVLLTLTGCAGGDSADRSDQGVTLFAAASTGTAMDEIAERFRRRHSVVVRTNYGGSSTLAQQIVNGAGADVFVSASEAWADYLQQQALIVKRRELLGNRLVVIVPIESSINFDGPEDLVSDSIRHLALADPEAVPAGVYAKQALTKLGIWEKLKARVVASADVRQAVSFVETASAEAGIVYATDAAVSESVRIAAEIATDLTEPIRYPIVLLRHASGHTAAESFYGYVNSEEAAGIFRKHGFTILDQRVAKRANRQFAIVESIKTGTNTL